jgi:membrane-bound ClpP family serine protease
MGNCLGHKTTIIEPSGPMTIIGPVTIINYDGKGKKKEPTYTSNQLYEVNERRGKSRRGGRPMITEA